MKKLKEIFSTVFLFVYSGTMIAQVPEPVNPGNVRGDEETIYMWSNPEIYIPVVVVVILLAIAFIYKKNRNSTSA